MAEAEAQQAEAAQAAQLAQSSSAEEPSSVKDTSGAEAMVYAGASASDAALGAAQQVSMPQHTAAPHNCYMGPSALCTGW